MLEKMCVEFRLYGLWVPDQRAVAFVISVKAGLSCKDEGGLKFEERGQHRHLDDLSKWNIVNNRNHRGAEDTRLLTCRNLERAERAEGKSKGVYILLQAGVECFVPGRRAYHCSPNSQDVFDNVRGSRPG